MANYTKKFNKPYENGYKDRPDTSTPVTAAIKNAETEALLAIEEYLAQNKITSVSIDGLLNKGYSIAIVEVDGETYDLNIPELSYTSAIKGGTKIGNITLGEKSYDLYAPIASAGDSNVSVAPKVTSGTNIATITVDGKEYQLYAPTGGGSGSTVTAEATLTEGTEIGKITIDGVETVLYAPTASTITVDDELSSESENPVQNKVVDAAVKNLQQQIDAGGTGGSITVDSALSTESENPVQNKVVTAELNKKIETLDDESQAPDVVNFDLDSELSLTSVKGVQNKAIAEEFQKYANGTKVVAKATEADTATTASNSEKVNGHTVGADVPSNAVFTDTVYDDSTVKASIQNIVNGNTQVGSATKATQDAQGNVINETYAKKTEVPQGTVVDNALSSTSTNPVQNKVVKAEFDQINSNLYKLKVSDVAGGKNLIVPTIQSVLKKNGIVITDNNDGTYTVNGTSTAIGNTTFDIYVDIKSQGSTSAKLLGCPPNDKGLIIQTYYDGSWGHSSTWDRGNGSTIDDLTKLGRLSILVPGGKTVDNLIFKPMITTDMDATYDDYEPYIPSVKMLASDLSNLKDGTTPVAKAVADEDGNNIKSTYAKKTEIPSTPSSLYETVNVDIITDLFAKSNTQYYYVNCDRVGNICTLSFWLQATASVDYKNRHELFDIDKIPKNNLTIGFCVVNFNHSVSNTANSAYNYINSISVEKDYNSILKRNTSKVYLLPYRTGSNILSSGYEIIGQISWAVEV